MSGAFNTGGRQGQPGRARLMRVVLGILAIAIGVPAPLVAQDTDTAIEQAQTSARQSIGVSQLAEPAGSVRAMREIEGAGRDGPAAAQLTAEPRSAGVDRQVSTDARSATEPTGISRPVDGRVGGVGTVERVAGDDLCAPSAMDRAGGGRPDVCKRVIETRSAQFARPERPTLSPEQRLLIDQRVREAPTLRGTRDRRFEPRATDPDRADDQAIASMVLDRAGLEAAVAAAGAVEQTQALPADAATLIDVILDRPGTQPPR